jgi:hypothetical protein
LQLSENGEIIDFLMDDSPDPVAYRISSAHEHDGKVFLGNLVTDFVSYVDLTKLPAFTYPLSNSTLGSWAAHKGSGLKPVADFTAPRSVVTHSVV